MLNRRCFLAASAGYLLTLGLPFSALAKNSSKIFSVPGIDQKLKAECAVYCDGQAVARLNLVGLRTPARPDARLIQYILNFEAARPVNLPEATYQLSHPKLGRLDLFLQPCGSLNSDEHDGRQYRACMTMLR